MLHLLLVTQFLLAVHLATGRPNYDPNECGKRPIGDHIEVKRVIDGQVATPNSWPWMAQLQQRNGDGSYRHKCGGSLIMRQWVVTAAHCLFMDPDPRAYRVVLGQHRRDAADGTEQVLSVSQVHLHDRFFTDTGYGYDIAVMKLARPARLNRDVGLVCLPRQNHRVQTGKSCYMTGWGATVFGPNRSEILREVEMPVVSTQTCSDGNSWFQPVDDTSMVCAGFGGDSKVSGCNGDSGGPLVCQEGGRWVLRGAVSWGDPRCRAGTTYSVFARVSSFIDWITCHTTTKHVDLMNTRMRPRNCRDRHYYCDEWKKKWGCCMAYFRKPLQLYCAATCGYCGADADPCDVPGEGEKRSIRDTPFVWLA